jgi:hypothetical protein
MFPAREGLVSGIPVVDGKTVKLFLQCKVRKVIEIWLDTHAGKVKESLEV